MMCKIVIFVLSYLQIDSHHEKNCPFAALVVLQFVIHVNFGL